MTLLKEKIGLINELKSMGIKDKKVLVKGFLCGCPMGVELNDCTITDIRRFPLKERISNIEGLKEKELDFLIKTHRECRTQREKKRNNIKLQRLNPTGHL